MASTLSTIQRDLSSLRERIKREEQELDLRAPAANILALVSSRHRLSAYEEVINKLSEVHPARIFVIFCDDALRHPEVEVRPFIHGSGKNASFSAEVILFGAALADMPRIPSVVRAHLVASLPAELLLSGFEIPGPMLELFLPLTDRVFLSSETFMRRFSSLERFQSEARQLIDVQWFALSPWRGVIRGLFELRAAREVLHGLQSVTIRADHRPGLTTAAVQLLVAGWIMDRLGLSVQQSAANRLGEGWQLTLGAGYGEAAQRRVELILEPHGVSHDGQPVLHGVSFCAGERRVEVTRRSQLEGSIEPGPLFRSSIPIEGESLNDLIERYFLIGESIANYSAALRNALTLSKAIGKL